MGNKRKLQICGTPAALRRHYRNGEDPCDSCKGAESARRAETPAAPTPVEPPDTASMTYVGPEEAAEANARIEAADWRWFTGHRGVKRRHRTLVPGEFGAGHYDAGFVYVLRKMIDGQAVLYTELLSQDAFVADESELPELTYQDAEAAQHKRLFTKR